MKEGLRCRSNAGLWPAWRARITFSTAPENTWVVFFMHKRLDNLLESLLRHSPAVAVFSIAMGLLVWQVAARYGGIPAFMLPAPLQVAARFWRALADGSLLTHTMVTLSEVLAGIALGVSSASVIGYGLAKSRRLERLLAPYLVASQAIPVVAIAPLLIIWFGPGLFSKVLICALIVFFPVLVNMIVGIRMVPTDLRDLMRSLQANRWQTFAFLEAPAALPVFLGGLRISATLSIIGAVVGEFTGADRGLGFLINVAGGMYDRPLVFVVIFTLIALAMSLYASVVWLENRLVSWQRRTSGY